MNHAGPRSFTPPLHAYAHVEPAGWRQIGGPYGDIDDVLDCCFEHLQADGASIDDVRFTEAGDDPASPRPFPPGALPA